jgi:hypothetical protein
MSVILVLRDPKYVEFGFDTDFLRTYGQLGAWLYDSPNALPANCSH